MSGVLVISSIVGAFSKLRNATISFITNVECIFILVINQIDAQNLFFNRFISCLYMFRAPCAHRQEGKNCIIQPLVSSHL